MDEAVNESSPAAEVNPPAATATMGPPAALAPAEATSNRDAKLPPPPPPPTKECINLACIASVGAVSFVPADLLILTHYHVQRKHNTAQYVCTACKDAAIDQYGRYCEALVNGQPLIALDIPKQPDLVEIIDSSDEEEDAQDASKRVARRSDQQDALPAGVLDLIEAQLTDALSDTLKRVDIDQQCAWTAQALEHRCTTAEIVCTAIFAEIDELQACADRTHRNLYRTVYYDIEELPPLDLNTNEAVRIYGPDYPPADPLVYPPVTTSGTYYAVRYKVMSAWVSCQVVEVVPGRVCQYKVRFARQKGVTHKSVSGFHLAYGVPPDVRLDIGVRVIALFKQQNANERSHYYPGIVAEPLQAYNRWRYLIFFDDGYAQYVSPDNVRLVCEFSPQVWQDVHADSAAFIKSYLSQYATERPMVQVQRGQRMDTEWQGKWLQTKVHAIDASLVQMLFEEGRRTEWIYRGSTRLGPLFFKQNYKHSAGMAKRNEPYVDYMSYATAPPSSAASTSADASSAAVAKATQKAQPAAAAAAAAARRTDNNPQSANADAQWAVATQSTTATPPPTPPPPPPPALAPPPTPPVRRGNVAKKSTASSYLRMSTQAQLAVASLPPPPSSMMPAGPSNQSQRRRPAVQHMNNSTIYVDEDNQTTGKVVYYMAKRSLPPQKYQVHACNDECLYEMRNNLDGYCPLSKPLLSGWDRLICRTKFKTHVVYRGPCGRRLRNMQELHYYLRLTKCQLTVDQFDYDPLTNCLAEYVLDSCSFQSEDLSEGLELMPVPSLNYYDETRPPPCKYSEKRIPNVGVPLNLDPEFLCGCDCEDDCEDKTKCQCWQLTLDGAKFGNPNVPPGSVGYEFKRLPEAVPTGIYECNPRCKCSASCLNRVAQHPLQMKLQVFKTGNRGWGLRCLNDVPKGSFVCVYAGDLLTEQCANEAGDNFGDEYFAELDYIEVVEALKEGYEPDVRHDPDEFDEDEESVPQRDYEDADDVDFVAKQLTNMDARKTRYNTRTKGKKQSKGKSGGGGGSGGANDDDDEDEDGGLERQPIRFVPEARSQTSFAEDSSPSKSRSIRKLYGRNESVYIMDAKKTGNIGRYFNHSCAPNLFVQNVFVDTHDLRFPWVAFFALSYIRAGSELTWNYNYDVGSVPGKVLYCECGAKTCRGRLL